MIRMIILTRRDFIKLIIKTNCKDNSGDGGFFHVAGEYRFILYKEKAYAEWMDSALDFFEYGYEYERRISKNKSFRYILYINGMVKVTL